RAIARSVTAEMHSGFAAIREHLSMDITGRIPLASQPREVEAEIARVRALWNDCRARWGEGGDFLFGRFSIADAFWAPVVTRFVTYGVDFDSVGQRYAEAILAYPPMAEWVAAAREEVAVRRAG